MKFSRSFAVVLLMSASPVFAHGGADGLAETIAGKPGDAKKATRTVAVDMRDYDFGVAELTFKAGETVKFVVTNKGPHLHEFTIGTAEQQAEHRGMMAKMTDMDHGAMSGHDKEMDKMASNAVHVKPGETKSLVWTFTHAGRLEFACNFPGHADLGMEGKIVVQ